MKGDTIFLKAHTFSNGKEVILLNADLDEGYLIYKSYGLVGINWKGEKVLLFKKEE